VKLDKAIDDVQDAEADLAKRLRVIGERHAAEHDLYHLGHTLARQCAQHVERITPFADRYGASRHGDVAAESPGLVEKLRHKSAELLGRSELSGLLLLQDLRELYLAAQKAELSWIILIQAAKAARDADLLKVATACHEQTETCARWLRTRIKEASPQVLATG
jgi:hypothetical protein